MTLTLKAILVALPVAAVVATASTLAALNIPWKVLPGNAGALVAARQWHPVSDELATVEQEPALTAEPQVPTTKAISVVDVPQIPSLCSSGPLLSPSPRSTKKGSPPTD